MLDLSRTEAQTTATDADASAPLFRIQWVDPETGAKGYVVIYSLMHGICGGGVRMRSGCTLEEVEGLARTMAIKKGLMRAVGGGAKGGIDFDPSDPRARRVLKNFVRSMAPLYTTCWSTGEDLGVRQEELEEVFEELGLGFPNQATINRTPDPRASNERMAAYRKLQIDGVDVATNIGGFGVAEAAAAATEALGSPLNGRTAVVQGFGSMGGAAARYLARLGVKVIGIADARGFVVNRDGLDVERLFAARSARGEIDRSTLRKGDTEKPRDDCLTYDADILVPAALGGAIHEHNADEVRAKLVVEASNLACTPGARRRLHEREVLVIPDFAANSATSAWFTWVTFGEVGPKAEDSLAKARIVIGDNVRRMVAKVKCDGLRSEEAATQVAMDNIREMNAQWGEHYPVVKGRIAV